MQLFMDLYSERDTLPTWVSAARCTGKVCLYPRCGVSCVDVILKWQDLAHSFSCWRARPGHLCCQSFIKRVRNSALSHINRLISGSRMSDNTLSTLMGNVPSRSVDSPKVNEGGCVFLRRFHLTRADAYCSWKTWMPHLPAVSVVILRRPVPPQPPPRLLPKQMMVPR